MSAIFKAYSNTILTKNQRTFDGLKDRKDSISVAEITKFLRDFGLLGYLRKEEISTLIRLINFKSSGNAGTQQLSNTGFLKFLINAAFMIYNRGDLYSPTDSVSLMFGKLLEKLSHVAAKQGILVEEQVDGTTKDFSKTIKFSPVLPKALAEQTSEGFSVVYEVLHEFISDVFGYSLYFHSEFHCAH